MICAPQAVAPTAPNKAESTATTIFAIVLQFFIVYLLSFFLFGTSKNPCLKHYLIAVVW